jgi:hypothetical protein
MAAGPGDRGEDRADVVTPRICDSCLQHDVFLEDDGEGNVYRDGCMCCKDHDNEHMNGCLDERGTKDQARPLVECAHWVEL